MSGREWCTLDEWLQCRRPLCPLVVRHEGRLEAQQEPNYAAAVRVCFSSARIGGAFLDDDATSQVGKKETSTDSIAPYNIIMALDIYFVFVCFSTQECAVFSSHPELLSLLPFTESLEDNEAISASGLANYSIIHDGPPAAAAAATTAQGNKASHPLGATTTTTRQQQHGLTSSSSCINNNSPPIQQVHFYFYFLILKKK